MAVKTFAVLAGSKRGNLPLLTHVAEINKNDEPIRLLCKRVKLESLADIDADDPNEPATCPVCSKLDPRNKQHENDGPFVLKSIFQF